MSITYRTSRRRSSNSYSLTYADSCTQINEDPYHSQVNTIAIRTNPDANGVACTISFTLPEDHPLLLWKLEIENGGEVPVFIDRIELLNSGPFQRNRFFRGVIRSVLSHRASPGRSAIRLHATPGELAFYSNGWGSWNYSAVYGHKERSVRSRLGPFTQPMRINYGTPQLRGRGRFASDMFAVLGDRKHRTGILLGFLSQKQHFGTVQASTEPLNPAVRLWSNGDDTRLDPERKISTDWACVQMLRIDDHSPLEPYLEAVGRENRISVSTTNRSTRDFPVGWCSWYHFFQDLSAQDVRDNLAEIQDLKDELPIDLIQIDDGYQSQVGDWLDFAPGFPDGIAPLAAEIREAGHVPGLWMAPFIVHPRSKRAQENRDWLLRNAWGIPVNAGFIWNRFTHAFDLTHHGVQEYVEEVVTTAVNDWGYPYLKLDFLYAAALPGRYRDPTVTRAQVLRDALVRIRQAAGPDTILLGCGCPLGSAIGIVDAMRIGADVAPNWNPKYGGIGFLFKGEPDFPAARNALQNVITRAFMHANWWVNDPDCLLIRPDSDLSIDEVRTMATVIAVSGGAMLLSDHLPEVPPDRMRIAKSLLPLISKRPLILDWFDRQTPERMRVDLNNVLGKWHILAYVNWNDRERDITLFAEDYRLDSGESYIGRDFWSGSIYYSHEENLGTMILPAHGSVLMAVRHLDKSRPQYLGSDLHISQGLEVTRWQVESNRLEMDLERPGHFDGHVDLYLPNEPREISMDDETISFQTIAEKIYRIPARSLKMASIIIEW